MSRGHIRKIRPIREDLDVATQKIIQISGQSRITLLNKYANSIKCSKFTIMRIMLFVVVFQLSILNFSTHVKKIIDKPQQTKYNMHSEL
jgi:hypothetical protein